MDSSVAAEQEFQALCFRFAGMTFQLEQVEHRPFPEVHRMPVALLQGGTEVCSFEAEQQTYLLVDHRSQTCGDARVEFWRASRGGEAMVAGLYALCDTVGVSKPV